MGVEDEALEWIRLDHAQAYTQLAVATCVIYDHITTFDLELELIWHRRKWSPVQYLYLTTRYVGTISQIHCTYVVLRHIQLKTVDQCRILIITQGIVLPLTLWTMQSIMMYRISSMYNHTRKIIILLLSAFAVEFMTVVLVSLSSMQFGNLVIPPPGVKICETRRVPLRIIIWIVISLFELLMLGLAVKIALGYFRSTGRIQRNSLAYVLLRDSVVFPLIAVLTCTISIISSLNISYFAGLITKTVSAMFPIILGCRLILNLRETYYQPFNGEMTLNRRDEWNYYED